MDKSLNFVKTAGYNRPIKGSGSKHRSDASELNYDFFNKVMQGSGASLKPTRNQKKVRNVLDAVTVVKTGASIWEQFKDSKFAYEFRDKRGVLLGGLRRLQSEVYRLCKIKGQLVRQPVGHLSLSNWGTLNRDYYIGDLRMTFCAYTPDDAKARCVKAWELFKKRRARKAAKANNR